MSVSESRTTSTGVAVPSDGSGAMFDVIADKYDLLNRLLSLGQDQRWRHKAARALGLREGDEVLDLATGTGDFALEIADTWPQAKVLGLDPSAKMLAIAEDKIRSGKLESRLTLSVGHAEALPFAEQRFAAVSMAFGIRNVPNRAAALAEIYRVLKPGGRAVILELSDPPQALWAAPIRWYVHGIVPAIGALISGREAYRYLSRSIAAFPSRKAFSSLMQAAGFEVEQVSALQFGAVSLFVGVRA